jgi:transcriptional regulator with XRE-family HTH domain
MTTAATAWIGEPLRAGALPWVRPAAPQQPVPPNKPSLNDAAVSSLVGRNLRRLRKQHRLSLEELARQSGVSRAMLGQIEQGKSIPSIKTLWQTAQALGVSVSWFLESGNGAQVLLMVPPEDSPSTLLAGDGELRSLQQLGDGVRDAFYELRLASNAMSTRRVNIAVSAGVLQVEVDEASHLVRPRQALQYETAQALVWRNIGQEEVRAYIVVRAPVKPD